MPEQSKAVRLRLTLGGAAASPGLVPKLGRSSSRRRGASHATSLAIWLMTALPVWEASLVEMVVGRM